MNFIFQSRCRNADMGDYAQFRNFVFATENPLLAGRVRKTCERNPHDYWEMTQEVKDFQKPEEVYKKKVGRPPKTEKVIRGFRDSEQSQGESV